jgi:hypothetical protein
MEMRTLFDYYFKQKYLYFVIHSSYQKLIFYGKIHYLMYDLKNMEDVDTYMSWDNPNHPNFQDKRVRFKWYDKYRYMSNVAWQFGPNIGEVMADDCFTTLSVAQRYMLKDVIENRNVERK